VTRVLGCQQRIVHPSKLPSTSHCDWSNAPARICSAMGIIGLANALRQRGLDVSHQPIPWRLALNRAFDLCCYVNKMTFDW